MVEDHGETRQQLSEASIPCFEQSTSPRKAYLTDPFESVVGRLSKRQHRRRLCEGSDMPVSE